MELRSLALLVSTTGPDYKVMPTTLDGKRTVLFCCHMMNDIVAPNGKLQVLAKLATEQGIPAKVAKAQKAARDAGVSVWHLQSFHRVGYPEYGPNPPEQSQQLMEVKALLEGSLGDDFIDECKPLEGEVVIRYPGVCCVGNSDLVQELNAWDKNTVVLCGVSTGSVILGHTSALKDLAYRVVIIGDCCSARSWEEHNFLLSKVLTQWATITSLEYFMEALKK